MSATRHSQCFVPSYLPGRNSATLRTRRPTAGFQSKPNGQKNPANNDYADRCCYRRDHVDAENPSRTTKGACLRRTSRLGSESCFGARQGRLSSDRRECHHRERRAAPFHPVESYCRNLSAPQNLAGRSPQRIVRRLHERRHRVVTQSCEMKGSHTND